MARPVVAHAPTKTAPVDINQGESSQSNRYPAELVTRMQAQIRGNQLRNKVSVSGIPDTGIVKVHIAGDSTDLARLGFENIDTTHGPKDLTYLAVPLDGYSPHLAGGERVHSPAEAPPGLLRQQLAKDRTDPESSRGPVVYINGSYYNSSKSSKASVDHDQAATIGKNKVVGAQDQPDPVPVPKQYADDYHRVQFPNGSTLTTGPLLSDRTWTGKSVAKFDERKAEQPKYKFPEDGLIRPGDLQHAEHPNPRSAVNFPAGIKPPLGIKRSQVPHKSGDAVRMLVASDASGKVGAEAQGLTMVELSNAMVRIGGLNRKPGPSYNLDGGASSVMGVLSEDGRKLMEVRGRPTEPTLAANFVTMEQHSEIRNAAPQSRPGLAATAANPNRTLGQTGSAPRPSPGSRPSAQRQNSVSSSLEFTVPPSESRPGV